MSTHDNVLERLKKINQLLAELKRMAEVDKINWDAESSTCDVVPFRPVPKRDTNTDGYDFEAIEKRNRDNAEREKRDRAERNKQTTKNYRLKKD